MYYKRLKLKWAIKNFFIIVEEKFMYIRFASYRKNLENTLYLEN